MGKNKRRQQQHSYKTPLENQIEWANTWYAHYSTYLKHISLSAIRVGKLTA
jgi:hypothetical protein